MDVDTCINEYLNMAPEIFTVENIMSRSMFGSVASAMTGTSRFDPNPFENAVKKLVREYLGREDETFRPSRENGNPKCKV